MCLGNQQRETQVKLELFDKRFAVFEGVETFVVTILTKNGAINLLDDYRKFLYLKEQAEFLFPENSSVIPYLTEVQMKAKKLWDLSLTRDREASQGNLVGFPEITELLGYFGDQAISKRNEIFTSYLRVDC